MIYKYIKATIAFFMLAGTTASALIGKNPETLNELEVRGSNNFEDLDLSRATILGEDSLETRQVNSLGDLNGLSPNVHLSGNGIKSFGDVLTIRGIGNTQFFGSPGVQLYVDGVPQGNTFSYSSDFYDLEAVEVRKGPQGSRFGRLAPGGSINLITRKPDPERKSNFRASYATFNTQRYDLSSSAPLNKQFSYSAAINNSFSDGFLNNTAGRNNDSESWNGRLSFYWDGGAGTKATLGANFSDHTLGAQPLVLRDGGDFYDRSTNFEEFSEMDQNQQYLKFEHELDSGKILSITNHLKWEMNPNRLDIDFSNQPSQYTSPGPDFVNPLHFMTSTIEQKLRNWSQELHYIHNEDSIFSWSLGTFYEDSDTEGTASRFIGVPDDPDDPFSPPYWGTSIPTDYSIKHKNLAWFIHTQKRFTDADLLSLDFRYDHFKKTFFRSNMGVQTHNESKDFSTISTSFSWIRTLSENLEVGSLIGYAEKPGGYSAFTNSAGQETFHEEQIISYEAFAKFSPTNDWYLKVTAFYNDIHDYQFELNGQGMDYYLENADEAKVYGVEIDSLWNFSDGWSFAAAYGLTESEFKKVSALPTLTNKQLTFIPEHSLSLILGHKLDNGLSYQLGSRTIGRTNFWDSSGTNINDAIDSYTLLEADIGYKMNDWSLVLFGTNLTDEKYYTSLVTNLKSPVIASAPGVAGSPRVIGLSIAREF